jgi:hypothetical protein
MTTRTIFTRWLGLQKPLPASTALTVHAPAEIIVQERPLPIPYQPIPIIIDLPPIQTETQTDTLSNFLKIGSMYHPLCRNAFVERVQVGYYAYERREEWRTCALAAAYAGAFGSQSIEKPGFSYSMAIWRLSQRIGFDIGQRQVVGPTGRHSNLADEMIKLVDDNLWSRAGVSEWVASLGY